MLTVKHHAATGEQRTVSCREVRRPATSPNELELVARGFSSLIRLSPGDVIYVENAAGKTIDVLRAKG